MGEQRLAEEGEWKLSWRQLTRKDITTELLYYSPRKGFLHRGPLKAGFRKGLFSVLAQIPLFYE